MFASHTLFITKLPTFHTWFVLAFIAVVVISYAYEKISIEMTSIFAISILMVFFHIFPLYDQAGKIILNPETILIGFANPALIAIIALLIIGQAIIASNALNVVPHLITKISRNSAFFSMILALLFVMIISAFMNNTPVVVIFIPILAEIARKLNISPSKVMIPLSYAAILGGMTTLIGSSTNLLVSGAMVDLGLKAIGFFDFVKPGAILASVGAFYILFILPRILPERVSVKEDVEDDRQFVSQVNISKASGFMGKQIKEGRLPKFNDITIRVIQRDNQTFLPPFQDHMEMMEGDVIAVSGTKKAIADLVSKKPKIFVKNMHMEEESNKDLQIDMQDANLAEIVISPASRMIGRTIKDAGFYSSYNCPVLAIQRKGSLVKTKITQLRLVAGDVLLVIGDTSKFIDLRNSKDVILTKWSTEEIGSFKKAIKTLAVFLAVILSSAFNILPIAIAAFVGAGFLIFLNCITLRQATRSIDIKITLMIVTSLALGLAMQETGAASMLAETIVKILAGRSAIIIILIMFIFTALMTNILSNSATAILFTPIAVNTAIQLGVDVRIFLYAVIFACNCSFITPIGYQTNLLVMSPGKYKFSDFVKGGAPLAILMCITYILYVKYEYPNL
jgi:di/tricarboxylate transporter